MFYLLSPIISTRATTTLKLMESMRISHNYFTFKKLRSILDEVVAISTNPEVFHDSNWCPIRSINDAKDKRKFLTVMTDKYFSLFFFYILHDRIHISGISNFLQPSN